MHIEIQVALNFVISYLYNKLPRRRVNLFGDELEKALRHKFEGHWYPEKPFKGSAFRCLKTGDPIDQVLEKAAKESGVLIADILEHLPNELSVWVDPGEVSYRIGEKGTVKILYSETKDTSDDSFADREVTTTFNPEAQCFRPIEVVGVTLNNLNIAPKLSPHNNSTSSSPRYKNTLLMSPTAPSANNFLNRSSEPLKFTTATFAQTKFGSTKLKNNSKKNNRMSPTEFSNYLKQKAIQQQYQHPNSIIAPVGHISVSPSRSLSPNSLALNFQNDPYYFSNVGINMYPQLTNTPTARNLFETQNYAETVMYTPLAGKCSNLIETQKFPRLNHVINNSPSNNTTNVNGTSPTMGSHVASVANANKDTKIVDGINTYHSNQGSSYQHLLVAN